MEVPARYARCTRKLCNLWQSPTERKEKYDYCKIQGMTSYMARRLRDWQWETIMNYEGYAAAAEKITEEEKRKCLQVNNGTITSESHLTRSF